MNSNRMSIQNLRRTVVMVASLVFLMTSLLAVGGAMAGDVENPWVIGLDLVGNTIGEDDNGDEFIVEQDGGGAALQFGYLFSRSFQLRFYVSGALHETTNPDVDVTFSGGLFEGVYLFRPGQNFRPYVFGGLGGFALESQEDNFTYSAEGPGASLGGGLHYFFNPNVSLHSSVRFEAVNWDTVKLTVEGGSGDLEIEVPVDESGNAAKFTVGLGFWF
jgi:Outer membrane protein beta-barrel domain